LLLRKKILKKKSEAFYLLFLLFLIITTIAKLPTVPTTTSAVGNGKVGVTFDGGVGLLVGGVVVVFHPASVAQSHQAA